MINYSSVNFYANSAASSGALKAWTTPLGASGAPDNSPAFCSIVGGETTAILYASGFNLNISAAANIASGFINVVHRPSGSVADTSMSHVFCGTGLPSSLTISSISPNFVNNTYTTGTMSLPASVLTPSVLNNPGFFLGVRYSSESTVRMDVDSIYLTLVYDVNGTPLYKTTSVFRMGASYRYL